MHSTPAFAFPTRGELMAEALGEFITDLSLVDVEHFVAYIEAAQWANISDLVHSAAELFLREGTLLFACSGSSNLKWGAPPSVSLDMEFQHVGATVFFTITLGQNESALTIRDMWFGSPPADHMAGTKVLAAALHDAKLAEPQCLQ